MTSDADRKRLLRIAREAIVAHASGAGAPAVDLSGAGAATGAAFVSLHRNGELRGCIGHLEATDPLPRVVRDCAIAASSADPRFAPVTAAEVPGLEIELSLLGPFEPVVSAGDVEIGRHGLMVEQGRQRGLLLPQVAVEWRWDRETFLAQTCHKAGLAPDAWRRGARVWRFEAEVFSEPATHEASKDS